MTIGASPIGLAPLGGAGTTLLIVDSGVALSSELLLAADRGAPVSNVANLTITRVVPLSDELSLLTDRNAPIDFVVGLTARNASLPTSALMGVARDAAAPVSFGRALAVDLSEPTASFVSLVVDRTAPLNALLSVASTGALPLNVFLDVAATGALPTSSTGALLLLMDALLPTSLTTVITRDSVLPDASSLPIVFTRVSPLGVLLNVQTDSGRVPLATNLLVVTDDGITTSARAGVGTDAHAVTLTQLELAVNSQPPVSFGLALVLDPAPPLATLLELQPTWPAPTSAYAGVSRDALLSLATALEISVEVESSVPVSTFLEIYIPITSDSGLPLALNLQLLSSFRLVVTAHEPPDATSLYVLVVPGGS